MVLPFITVDIKLVVAFIVVRQAIEQ